MILDDKGNPMRKTLFTPSPQFVAYAMKKANEMFMNAVPSFYYRILDYKGNYIPRKIGTKIRWRRYEATHQT